jgi:hypothetical protein
MHLNSKALATNLDSVLGPTCTYCGYRYRPSSSKSYAMGQASPTSAAQMYAYNNYPFQRQQVPNGMPQMSRPSPPQSTWAVPQTHNSYYAGPQRPMLPTRDGHAHFLPRSDINTSGAALNNGVSSSIMSTSAEYFPNVIDTSTSRLNCPAVDANSQRSLEYESMR